MTTRTYSSPLRERQAQQTRELIIDSLTDLLEHHRTDEITTRELAAAAGVSERTVYRHFPDRDALLGGLADRVHALSGGEHPGGPITAVDDFPRAAIHLMAALDSFQAAARAEALFNADPRRFSSGTRENTEHFRDLVIKTFPELDNREAVGVAAVIRCLLSAQAWLRMREEFGMPGTESGPVVAWVIETLLREVRRGNHPGGAARRAGAAT